MITGHQSRDPASGWQPEPGWEDYFRREAWKEQRVYRQQTCLPSPWRQSSPFIVESNSRDSKQLPALVNHNDAAATSEPEYPLSPPPDPQAASLFFNRLPPELRLMVWAALWDSYCDGGGGGSSSLRYMHIYTPDNRRLSFSPCCVAGFSTGPGHDDAREEDDLALLDHELDLLLMRKRAGLDVREDQRVWGRRLASDWDRHWRCEEKALRLDADTEIRLRESGVAGWSTRKGSLLSILLACKRM